MPNNATHVRISNRSIVHLRVFVRVAPRRRDKTLGTNYHVSVLSMWVSRQ